MVLPKTDWDKLHNGIERGQVDRESARKTKSKHSTSGHCITYGKNLDNNR